MGNRWVGIPPRSQSSQSQRYTSFKKVLFQIEQENLSLSVSQCSFLSANTTTSFHLNFPNFLLHRYPNYFGHQKQKFAVRQSARNMVTLQIYENIFKVSTSRPLLSCQSYRLVLQNERNLCKMEKLPSSYQHLKIDFYMKDANGMMQKNISDELCSCLEEWIPGYEEKLVKICAVSDNAANVKPAMRRLNFKSLYCFAHTLQFVVNSIS